MISIGNTPIEPATAGDSLYSYAGMTQDFQIANTSSCLSFTALQPSQTCAFSVAFAPAAAGVESETVTSIFNTAAQVQLGLHGSTTNAPSNTAAPGFSPNSGTFATPQSVTLSDATYGATIYYTTDGSTPTTGSPVYGGPISVTTTTTINAFAVAPDYNNSTVSSATYAITP